MAKSHEYPSHVEHMEAMSKKLEVFFEKVTEAVDEALKKAN